MSSGSTGTQSTYWVALSRGTQRRIVSAANKMNMEVPETEAAYAKEVLAPCGIAIDSDPTKPVEIGTIAAALRTVADLKNSATGEPLFPDAGQKADEIEGIRNGAKQIILDKDNKRHGRHASNAR